MLKKTIKAGVCLAVFSLPLYLIRFKISWIPFNLSEIIIYLVFLLWLADKLNGFWKSSFRIQKSDFQNHSHLSISRRQQRWLVDNCYRRCNPIGIG